MDRLVVGPAAGLERHSEELEWLSYEGTSTESEALVHCATWLASLGFDRVVTRTDRAVLAYTFGDSAQGLIYLPEGATPPAVLLGEYRTRSVEPIVDGWHHFTADF